jgi:hypothetical protein
LEQTFHRAVEAALGQARHHQHVVAQRSERLIERSKDMFWRYHVDLSDVDLN